MKSLVCVDAGIFIKVLLKESLSERARALWGRWAEEVRVVAPTLFAFEVTSLLRKQAYRGLITPEEGEEPFALSQEAAVTLVRREGLHRHAWEMAKRLNRPAAYDAHHLALPEMLGCEFWTADERLYNAVKDELPWVRWIGEA